MLLLTPAGLGQQPRPLTPDDIFAIRNVSDPQVSPDSTWVAYTVSQMDRQKDTSDTDIYMAPLAGGAVERIIAGERDIAKFDVGIRGDIAVLESTSARPNEISIARGGGSLTQITRSNDRFLAGIQLGKTERFQATSADGTIIDGYLTRSPQSPDGTRLPTLLRIHGGPVSQCSTGFNLEWQMLAAAGYAVIG